MSINNRVSISVSDLEQLQGQAKAWVEIFDLVIATYPRYSEEHVGTGLDMVKTAITLGSQLK